MQALKQIRPYMEAQEKDIIKMLEKLVNQDSGTSYVEGVNKIAEELKSIFSDLDYQVEEETSENYGKNLIVRSNDQEKPKKILIIGHMDTVFPEGTVKERPFYREGDYVYGPGANDMKSGLTAVYWALKAINQQGLENQLPSITILLNGDEEVGSPTSRQLIENEAQNADYALVLEPGRSNGEVVTARKGVGRYTLTCKGKAVHSGVEPEKGISAVIELSDALLEIHQLNDYQKGTTYNAGTVQGGTAVNVVPEEASAEIDLRIETMEEAVKAEANLEGIASESYLAGAKRILEGEINRPPMQKTEDIEALYKEAQQVAAELGFELPETKTGGGSDASFTAAMGVPTLDGLGPIGGGSHGLNEYSKVSSYIPRITLLAGLILRLAQ